MMFKIIVSRSDMEEIEVFSTDDKKRAYYKMRKITEGLLEKNYPFTGTVGKGIEYTDGEHTRKVFVRKI